MTPQGKEAEVAETSAREAVAEVRRLVESAGDRIAEAVADGGKISVPKLNAAQPEAFGLARRLAEITAAEAILEWGEAHGELERDIAETYAAETVAETARWALFEPAAGGARLSAGASAFVASRLATARLSAVAGRMLERDRDFGGALGLTEDHVAIQREFAKFADEQVAPLAEEIHRHDKLIPEPLLSGMAGLGVFGISIPEDFGGTFIDHTTMIIATEELSRGSLGAGGSVITRPEICAKAILAGGTDEQKAKWLPALAAGERVVSVAVTEPDAGSDVAAVKVTARKADGGWLINGEKTWCTFAGRADVFVLLARTGGADEGHRGLTLFLVEKPATKSGEGDEYAFDHTQDGGGAVSGRAIPTVGYRGMHSFAVSFEDYFVPEENRVGEEGKGFYLQMKGFEGGRIQTAARAVGVMEAALRESVSYVRDRKVFGKPLADYAMSRVKLVQMAARIQAGRQLAYAVGRMMDEGQGSMEASLVKFLVCRDAEWVTREAMQLHGGMGYSEEYAVSRYWQDARVLSIFEGAEEVLALLVIARQYLGERLST
jgi:(2S)-methylsuccinyl-CoA dehydrogenase